MTVTLLRGDARHLPLADETVDAVVTDPPYGLAFMGRAWDQFSAAQFEEFCATWAAEALRVLRPGGHLLAFGGTRTWHRLAAGIEDAGFELRDTITWIHGSGFPKSVDVAKAISATQRYGGANSVRLRQARMGERHRPSDRRGNRDGLGRTPAGPALGDDPERWRVTELTDDARRWAGWGTALKPASEPIIVARKPLIGPVAGNVLEHGVGGINIDACRVAHDEPPGKPSRGLHGTNNGIMGARVERHRETTSANTTGRWPANVVLSHPQACTDQCAPGCPVADLDQHAFFPAFRYQAKAGPTERPRTTDGTIHPTVKPLQLMRWLCRLVVPPGGRVLDPFAGSGTTAEAALLEGLDGIGIESEPAYLPLIVQRIQRSIGVAVEVPLFDLGGEA